MPISPDGATVAALLELRALVEELLAAGDDARRQDALAALRLWSRIHCASCGDIIDHELRRRDPPESYCFICFPPPEPGLGPRRRRRHDPDDVPF